MTDPKRKEEDTLSEAGKRKAASVGDTIAAPVIAVKPSDTLKIERRRRRKKKEADDELGPIDVHPNDVEIIEKAANTSITPLTGTQILASGTDSDPSPPSSSLLPLSERMPLSNPQGWDRYEILGLLGKGGMGSVFEARDKRIERHVALKFIHTVDSYMTSRFLQEARAQARLDHPNICKVLEVGEVEGRVYIAMQLIKGQALSDASANMTLDEKVRLLKTVTEAVEAAHRSGIIHRDIKPANIMVETLERKNGLATLNPILMDFGLAREESAKEGLTESGALLGTPGYMSPEQARGQARGSDARTDVYGIGATLYDLLTGAPPFVDANAMNVVLKVLTEDPVPLRMKDPEIPQALDTIVMKCLAKEPHLRYGTAAELADDLERYLSREKVLARRLSWPERLYWRGKRNKPMAFAVIALAVSLVAFAGYGIDTVIMNVRREAIAQKRAELGKKLGEAVKDLDWLVRTAHLVPLHDTTAEKAIVRERMASVEAEMRTFADLGAGFDHYALGRGHLALEEWELARNQLQAARDRGIQEPELEYGLGRALGELYSRALEDARKSGDASYFAKRKVELDAEYLVPALAHLERCRGLSTVSANYLEALIHFYNRRYDEALAQAVLARQTKPWLYEAAKLEGDVFLARALDAKDRGDNESAEHEFDHAVGRYEQAADIGRSDHQVYEALAEAWIRQEELDLYRGRDPKPKLEKALTAADKSLVAAPKESSGYTKRAFAYYFQAQYAQGHGAPREEVEKYFHGQIDSGKEAIALNRADAYAQDITGIAYTRLAEFFLDRGESAGVLLEQATVCLEEALRLNPKFPWAYNDYGYALGLQGYAKKRQNEDPKDLLQKAIDTTKKAVLIDDQYFMAYNDASIWLNELAGWQVDHGENPEVSIDEAVQMADRAIQINKRHPLAYGNSGLSWLLAVTYRRDAGLDGRETAHRAIERFKAMLEIDPNVTNAIRELARAYQLLANQEQIQGLNPTASIDEGLRILKNCFRIEPENADCKIAEASLGLEQAKWAQSQKQPFRGLFDQARRTSGEATKKMPNRSDFWLTLAVICLEQAQALKIDTHATGYSANQVVDEGIAASAQALELAPESPQALAVEGSLYLQKADIDPVQRTTTLSRAKASLLRAFEGNPTLKLRYGAVAAEVDRKMKEGG
jgi:serine/threonine-protein kinase